jgi:hypothetical protein
VKNRRPDTPSAVPGRTNADEYRARGLPFSTFSMTTVDIIVVPTSMCMRNRQWGCVVVASRTSGVQGNERLTATIGLVLLVLLAVEGFTVLSVRGMFGVHVFVGLLLIPPIGLKLASTGYRFTRYYTGNRAYRQAGPPSLIPRIIAPFLVLCTITLFGTGVLLLLQGPQQGDTTRTIHTVAFFFWFFLMSVHVLTYVWRSPALALADLSSGESALRSRVTRQSLVVGSVLLGIVAAVVFLPLDASWVQWLSFRHFGG